MAFDRRHFLSSAILGAGALVLPDWANAAQILGQTGFTHHVASGEPAAHSILLWTRYVPTGRGAAKVRVEVSESADFARIVAEGQAQTGPWRDHTVKITVTGLAPYRDYFYRFIAPDGTLSPLGRTRTLPVDSTRPWKAAIFSCSNLPFGYFNAYAHAATRDDIDCVIHLGDYFYEYAAGQYPAIAETVAQRFPQPMGETLSLFDYRLRFASYRMDPDLQALHARFPMIAQWDDHETANDSWEGGAENHDHQTEGPWGNRREAAMQVYREWLPVSDEPWKSYDIGALATLFRTETRLLGRTNQPDIAPLFREADPVAALKAFRDGAWQDPSASMMGSTQEAWLDSAMRASARSGRPWQLVGFGTIMGQTVMPQEAGTWINAKDPREQAYMQAGMTAARLGLPFNFDNWGGYPAARARFLRSAQQTGGNTVVLAGDSHNAWAYNLAQDGKPAAVEFAGHSVTSPGFEASLSMDPAIVAKGLVGANPELAWCDTSRRGYMALTVTKDKVTSDWIMMDTILTRSTKASIGHSVSVAKGRLMMA